MRTLLATALLAASFATAAAHADGCLPEVRPVSGYAVRQCHSGEQDPRHRPVCLHTWLEVGGENGGGSVCTP